MRRLLAFVLLTSGLCAYAATSIEVRTAITEFLPHDEGAERLSLARALSSSPQSRLVVLTLSSRDVASHREAARELGRELAKEPEVEWVRSGLAERDQELFYALYFPARLGLLELPEGEGPVPDAWIAARVTALKARLATPFGMLERRLAPKDPLGAFAQVMASYGRSRGRLTLADGQLMTEDGRWSVVFLSTRAPAFDSSAQRKVALGIERAFAAQRRRDASLVLEWSGVNRFALAGEDSVRRDIERISMLSLVGIFLLYWFVFRSAREPLVVLVPLGFGCVLAVVACQLIFGFVHGLALAFGSTIIGVAEDYSTHFFAHRRAAPREESNEALMVRLWPGMLMGGVTTIAGLLALVVSGFPGLEQMAVFGSVGVLGALLCTRYVVPLLSRKGPLPPTRTLGPLGTRIVRALSLRPRHATYLLVPAVALALWGVPRLLWQDGMRALRTPTPALDAENERVQRRLGRSSSGRVVVALGRDDQEALERAESVQRVLHGAQARGLVHEARSVTTLVPSLAAQKQGRARLRNDVSFVPRLRAELLRAGFAVEAFASFEQELLRREATFVTPQKLTSSPFSDLLTPFRAQLPLGVAYLTPVSTHRSRELEALFAGLEGVHYIDQEALFGDAYRRFRARALKLLGVGLALVLLTLFLRYRSPCVALLGMLPAVVGAFSALGVQGALGLSATSMHVISVLLVLSMGVDYGIYVLESRHSIDEGVTTLGGVLLAALTTVLSFGLLALSDNPALSGIGLTVALGLFFTVLVSPVVLALAGPSHTP